MGKMNFDKVGKAHWFDVVTPFAFGMPTFDLVMILTMTLVMIVVMIESTGMFLALSDITGKKIGQPELAAGLRTDGLGTLIGGIFNTFPYTSFSQNVGLVGVTGVRSRYVCVAGGIIMIVLGLLPKMAALVESIPQFVLGGAGLVMFGMVAATGIRILSTVDYKNNRNNLYIVALAIGFGLIPLVAPRWTQQMAHGLHPLLESRHPADRDRGGGAEPVLQRRQGRRSRRDRGGQGGRGALRPTPERLRAPPKGRAAAATAGSAAAHGRVTRCIDARTPRAPARHDGRAAARDRRRRASSCATT